MSNFNDFFANNLNAAQLTQDIYTIVTESKDITIPDDGRDYFVLLQGAGGSGSARNEDSSFQITGGASGYHKLVNLTRGKTYTFSIGAGGSPVNTFDSSTVHVDGIKGGDTSITYDDTTITAIGGGGGISITDDFTPVDGMEWIALKFENGTYGNYTNYGYSKIPFRYSSESLMSRDETTVCTRGGASIFGIGGGYDFNNSNSSYKFYAEDTRSYGAGGGACSNEFNNDDGGVQSGKGGDGVAIIYVGNSKL